MRRLAAAGAFFALAGELVVSGSAVRANICFPEDMGQATSPDGSLVATARAWRCTEAPGFTYDVVVNRQDGSADQQTVFESRGFPAPTGLRFVSNGRLVILADEPPAMDPEIYPVAFDPATARPERVWRIVDGVAR